MEPGDPPDVLTVWRKGSAGIHIRVKGRAAHAGVAPQDGRNAATELIHQLDSIEDAVPHERRRAPPLNLTVLQAGERTNIIPDAGRGEPSACASARPKSATRCWPGCARPPPGPPCPTPA